MNEIDKVRDFVQHALRVLNISYHPTQEEFNTTAKITGLGMVLIGVIGYLITLVFGVIDKLG
jgi:protein transport protein SEC61 subunit gamma-like protein